MTGDPRDAPLLIGDTTVDELVELAQRLPADRVRVLALAAALAQVAFEGEMPESYVLDAVRTAMKAAKAPDPTAH
jgi:chromosome condensin MukBEF complex kleisin-like MukF subunit